MQSPTRSEPSPQTLPYARHQNDSSSASTTLGHPSAHRNRSASPSPNSTAGSANKAPHLSWPLTSAIGGPLESVLEGDVETDGATTPGSMLQSPMPWNSCSAKKASGAGKNRTSSLSSSSSSTLFASPNCTIKPLAHRKKQLDSPPSMDHLSLSASTAKLLRQRETERFNTFGPSYDDMDEDNSSPPYGANSTGKLSAFVGKTSRPLQSVPDGQQLQQDRPWNNEFREEDDMITLDTQSTLTKNSSPVRRTTTGSVASGKLPPPGEDRSSFFARMEGMLHRVEETIFEDSPSSSSRNFHGDGPSRPSDEILASLAMKSSHATKQLQHRSRNSSKASRTASHPTYYEDSFANDSTVDDGVVDNSRDNSTGSEDDAGDDSTNLAPTLVAEKDRSFRGRGTTDADGKASKRLHPLNTLQQQHDRPTHIMVNTAIGSPAHTNITMDATVMNETFVSFLGMDETQLRETIASSQEFSESHFEDPDAMDNLSIVTPVLDRYRLDPDDDTSVGIKVVPNERGSHKKSSVRQSGQKQLSYPFKTPLSRPKTPKQTTPLPRFSASNFLSPKATPTALAAPQRTPNSVSTRINKVYRKTPFPKRKASFYEEEQGLPTLSENDHPNTSTGSSVAGSPELLQKPMAPLESISISVPPLRSRSLDSRRLERKFSTIKSTNVSYDSKSWSDNESVLRIDQEEIATIHQIDKTIERIDQELATGTRIGAVEHSSGRVDPVGKSFLNQVKTMAKPNSTAKSSTQSAYIEKITAKEFEGAPRIVRDQVSVEEANDAIYLLRDFCKADSTSFEFSEERGHEILSSLTKSKPRSKSILISLCHWQRLSMKRDTIHGTMVFVLKNSTKGRTFVC